MRDGSLLLARKRRISATGWLILSGVQCSFFPSSESVSQVWFAIDDTARDAKDWGTSLLYVSL